MPQPAHDATAARPWAHRIYKLQPAPGLPLRQPAKRKPTMRILKWVVGIVLLMAALLVVGGLLLSPTFSVQRSVIIDAPAPKIYALLASPRQWAQWSAWNRRDPDMQIAYSGPESGAGAAWSWSSEGEGDGKMTFTAAEPDKRLAYALYFPDFGTTSTGELNLRAEGRSTRVSWSLDGDMGANPLWRWFALFMDRLVGKDFEEGLANLKSLAEKP
jgi:uncharacterized protein YndB with AHSA1/START domain